MKIYSWNINGIRAVHKKGYLEPFIEQHQPDILCFQETKAMQDQSIVDFPDYDEYWNSADKKGYSGTAIFTKIAPERVLKGIPDVITKAYDLVDRYGDTTKEGRVLTLEFEHFYVSTVYTPNAKDDLSRLPVRQKWDQAYLAYMKQLERTKPVVFCGDLNAAHTELDLARPKENKGRKGFTDEERGGITNMIENGFADSFRMFHKENGFYTWWSHFSQARERNVGWRIDYIMISGALTPLVIKAAIHADIFGSDHCPVSLELRM
ncbi:MAG: exodeoxyribonuclease III [Candidatus Paceibacterota bacterium]